MNASGSEILYETSGSTVEQQTLEPVLLKGAVIHFKVGILEGKLKMKKLLYGLTCLVLSTPMLLA